MENVEESNNDLCASIVRNNWERRILAGTTESGRSIYLISMELGKFFFSLPTDLDENSFFGKIKEWREIESRRGIMQKK